MTRRIQCTQKAINGFTFIEIAVAMAVLGILALVCAKSLSAQHHNPHVAVITSFMESSFPMAVSSLQAKHGRDLTALKANLKEHIVTRGIDAKTVYGEDWDIEFNEQQHLITLAYPVSSEVTEDSFELRKQVKDVMMQMVDAQNNTIEAVALADNQLKVTYKVW